MKYLLPLAFAIVFFASPADAHAKRLFMSGFEIASTSSSVEFDTVTGTISFDTTTKRTGNYALRANPVAATEFVTHTFRADSTNPVFFRAHINVATCPPVTTDSIILYEDSGGIDGPSIRMDSGCRLELWDAGTSAQIGSDSSALSTGTWYCIQYSYDDSVAGNTATAYVETAPCTASPSSFATGDGGDLAGGGRISYGAITAGLTIDIYFDDVAVNDNQLLSNRAGGNGTGQTGLPGAGSIAMFHPNDAGDNDGGGSEGSSLKGFGYLDTQDWVPDDDQAYYNLNAANDIGDFNVDAYSSTTAGTTANDTISLIEVSIRHRAQSAASGNLARRLKSQASGTVCGEPVFTHNDVTWRTNGDVTPRQPMVCYVDPQDGSAFTVSDFGSLQLGASTTDATPDMHVTMLWAEVEFIPGTPPATSEFVKPPDIIKFD